jgi:HAD superfamily hydrolase (TIGR01509 family)
MSDKWLIIFDCDGTLVDSEKIANEVFIEQVKEYGVLLNEEEAWQNFPGTSLASCIAYIENHYATRLPEDFEPEYRARTKIAFKRFLKPIPGVADALSRIKHQKCVASNGPAYMIKFNLGNTGLLPHFNDRIFSAHDINRWKPDPALFLHAAKACGYDSNRTIVVEDSPAGITGANAAGMKVLAFIHDHNSYTDNNIATCTFSDMSTLPELIHAAISGS